MHYKATIILAAAGVARASTVLPVKRALATGWSAYGCYTDSWDRTLPNSVSVSGSFTNEKCVAACDAGGYTFAGTENGSECYCGNSLASTGTQAPDGDCSTKCTGSSSQKCGGGWRLTVSKKTTSSGGGSSGGSSSTFTPPDGWSSAGCYTDSWTRTIANQVSVSGSFTMTNCINTCAAAGYTIAGAEAGNECYCANAIASSGTKAADGDCATKCTGNSAQTCGGGWRLSTYKKASTSTPWSPPSGWSYAGCYTDSATRTITKYSTSSNSMTLDTCISTCNGKGYKYAGAEAGNECYCGDTLASSGPKASSDSDCATPCTGNGAQTCGGGWRLSVYQSSASSGGGGSNTTPTTTATTPTSTPTGSSTWPGQAKGWKQEGCYTDDWTRTLQGYSSSSGTQTVEACQDICYQQKFRYAGLEAGTECYCADQIQNGSKVGNGDCSTACAGSNSEQCGGGWRLSVYSHEPATSGPSTFERVGCFVDSSSARFLRDYTAPLGNSNSVENCISACAAKGYGYAGVEYGAECYCGDQLWNVQTKDDSECNVMKCAGNSGEYCGAGNRIMLYQDTLGWCS